MMRTYLCLLCICLLPAFASATSTDYAVASIPPAILQGADAVKREETVRLTMLSLHKVEYYHRYVLTILNEKGDEYAVAEAYYNRLNTINYIYGTLYDAAGNELKRLNKSDISDYSGTGEGNFADDYKIQKNSFYCKSYPYTVVYEVAQTCSFTMAFLPWQPVDGERMAVMQSALEVIVPQDYNIRYRAFDYKLPPVVTQAGGRDNKQLRWEVTALTALEKEYAAPYWSELTPTVLLAPTRFQLQNYEGSMDTWQQFGKFIYTLNRDRDALPDATKAIVHQLTDTCKDPREKVARLYRYLQENTRYISIQLGIGGWQTYDATYVAERKYGDCKALVNFMQSLLKEAGIASSCALVNAGGSKFFVPDFPVARFNHIILAVPLAKDTIWLECTSQTLPPGYLSSFTADRYALLINAEGGTLIRTPVYGINENLQLRHIDATADSEGNLTMNVVSRYQCLQQDELHHQIHGRSKEMLLAWVKESELSLPDYDVMQYRFEEDQARLPSITETMQVSARNYAQVSGHRLFIGPNLLSQTSLRPVADDTRKYDVLLANATTSLDTVVIHLPDGYSAESLPPPVKLGTAFGRYSASVQLSGNTLIYYRKLERFNGRFPAKDYNELVHFLGQIYKADRAKAVLVKKEAAAH